MTTTQMVLHNYKFNFICSNKSRTPWEGVIKPVYSLYDPEGESFRQLEMLLDVRTSIRHVVK